jgi:hypothetical protein
VAPDAAALEAKANALSVKFAQIERRFGVGPYSLADAPP